MTMLLKEVLEEIKPTPKEEKEVKKRIDEVIKKIKSVLPQCKVVLGGSGDKGTWLRNSHDADIFVLFKDEKNISDLLEKKLKKVFKISRLHGSRDYFQIQRKDFIFEIIPIRSITKADQARNITDISPLHAKWVKKHKQYADDIRLTKQFFKAAKVYGAESYINGFSGYVCEVLTVHYKGFSRLVKEVSQWKEKVIVDIEKFFKGKKVLFELDKAKTVGPLVVIDPVQQSRNAAAAVSHEKFETLVQQAKKFVKNQKKEFFEIHSIEEIVKKKVKKNELITITLVPKSGKRDITGCKLLKVFQFIKNALEKDFSIIYADWEWENDAMLYFILKKEVLDKEKIVKGPPNTLKKFVKEFKQKHKNTFIKKDAWFAKEKREFRTAKELVKMLSKDNYIKERVKKIRI